MSFINLDILRNYKTNSNNIVKEFYIPILKESVLYKRAVGFFSSTALVEISRGLSGLISNEGKIKFIVSPLLSEEDINAIKRGYNEREIVEQSLLRNFSEPQNNSEKERLNWLANLISSGIMEIKVAFTSPQTISGMYHEKIGIMYDSEGNRISFTGSMNETINAFYNNYESIVVFNSLRTEDIQRVEDVENNFDSLWDGREEKVSVIDFPKAVKDKIISYKKDKINWDLDKSEFNLIDPISNSPKAKGLPCFPDNFSLHNYQDEAIKKWAENDYRGIFDMATGTGKTYTGLGAIVNLFEKKKKVAAIIVCPYQHLVEQWVEDIKLFNMLPTIGYSSSTQKDWKKRLSDDIMDYKLGVIPFFCFVTTNATFSSEYVQTQLSKLKKNILLVVDEAHNFGSPKLQNTLDPRYEFRLALSATIERHNDENGTNILYEYFGDKCIEYDIERAIKEDKLTKYYYHPHIVYLTEDELEKYREISKKIVKQCHKDNKGKLTISEIGKKYLIERSRIVAGASNKVGLLKELMQDYKNDSHILVYCGAARNPNFASDEIDHDIEGERQIVSVSKMLGNDLGMKVTHFTSCESSQEREVIKKQFANADPYQAIVAIKCLDEGVNIPSIKTAFILASSTNPKEYIQRRGRVLRKAEGKKYAVIHDFITLPYNLSYVSCESENARYDISLVKKEIIRMKEFGEISENPSDADKLIKLLMETYGLDKLTKEEYFDE